MITVRGSMRVVKGWLVAGVLVLAGCTATVGVSNLSIPPDAAVTCAAHCKGIGLELSAVAIMANNVGCVCEASSARGDAATSGRNSAPAAGMATLLMQQEEMQRYGQQGVR